MKYTILLFFLFSVLQVNAQKTINKSDKYVPQWMSKYPKALNPSYTFVVVSASAPSLEEAREYCLVNLASNEQLKRTISVAVDKKHSRTVDQQFDNGKLSETIKTRSNIFMNIGGKDIELTANKIDEYWQQTMVQGQCLYTCYSLYAVAIPNMPLCFDRIRLSERYGFKGFLYSLIPGGGQLYKGQKLKGACLMGGEILLVGGVIVSENMRSSYVKKMKEQPKFADVYNTKADNSANIRNVFIGAAAALYVYNLIDASISPGARRVILEKQYIPRLTAMDERDYTGLTLIWDF